MRKFGEIDDLRLRDAVSSLTVQAYDIVRASSQRVNTDADQRVCACPVCVSLAG